MSNPTTYIRINSGAIGLVKPQGQSAVNFQQSEPDIGALRERPHIPAWRERSEADYLNRAHPGPSGTERALEDRLWNQVSGKASASVQPSAQLQSEWARFQATRTQPSRREIELEAKLFEQVAETGPRRPQIGDSSHFAGKTGL